MALSSSAVFVGDYGYLWSAVLLKLIKLLWRTLIKCFVFLSVSYEPEFLGRRCRRSLLCVPGMDRTSNVPAMELSVRFYSADTHTTAKKVSLFLGGQGLFVFPENHLS